MSSILTNTSAMSALQTLRSINEQLDTTQSRISSGKKVAGASDNAAYWSIATTMKSDNSALSTVSDALGLGAATVDTAYNGMNSAIDVVDQIKSKLVAAKEPGVDKGKVQKDITQLQDQLKSIASSSSFNGENWLEADASPASFGSQDIVGSFNRDANGNVSVTNLTIATSATLLIDTSTGGSAGLLDATTLTTGSGAQTASILTLDITATGINSTDLDDLISFVDKQMGGMTDAASDLGSAQKRISMQTDFVKNLMDTIDKGVGRLVDADMNQESTRLKALQTQQQLGIQALSIANSNSQNILSLFR